MRRLHGHPGVGVGPGGGVVGVGGSGARSVPWGAAARQELEHLPTLRLEDVVEGRILQPRLHLREEGRRIS